MKKCINFFIAFLCCLFFSCDMEIEEILRQKRLEYISVDTTEAVKLEYLIGDKFNSEGIKIYGHYSDETQVEEDLRLVSFSGFDSSQAAEKNTITVLFNEKETTFDVKIHESKIEKIQIIQKPIKQFFRVGESNDTTGIIVKAIYTNGNETPLAEDEYILEGFDSSKAGMCLVNVILKADTKIYDTYTVVFQDYDITGITINKQPNKLIYMVGEELDLTGLEVYATPENGLPPFLLPQYNYSPASIKDITATGKQTITINVNEVKASFDIEIVDAYVKGFVIKDKDGNGTLEEGIIEDSKRIYCAGDTFKLEHFAFYELYSNDAIGQEITKENKKMEKLSFVFGGEEHGYEDECQFGDEPGVYTIPIRYEFEDITTKENTSSTIEIKVCVTDSEIDGIEATWSSYGASGYPKWITPDNSNHDYGKWTVNAILKTKDEIDITNMCSFEYTETNSNNRSVDGEGKVEVTVKYHDIRTKTDFKTTGKVKVKDRILQKVEIDKLPKTEYVVGENVELGGLVVKGTYSDGEQGKITRDGIEKYEPTGIENNNQSQIVVTYQDDVTCTIPIKIKNNDVIGIRETYSGDLSSFNFREGGNYDSSFFCRNFNIYKIRQLSTTDEKCDEKDLNFTIKEGQIIIVYKSGQNTYSTIYENESIRILPALPTSVEIVAGNETYAGLDNIKTSKNTQLRVKYGSVENETLTNNNGGTFTDEEVGKYELVKTNDRIDVKFTPEEYAVDEDKSFVKNFENVLSKNKIIVKRETEDDKKEIHYKTEVDDFSDLNVYMEYSNDKKQKINNDGNNQNPKFEILWGDKYDYTKETVPGKILVTYTDTTDQENPETYYCTYDNVEYSPPKPISINVDLKEQPGNVGSEESPICIGTRKEIFNKLSWTVEYEDGSKLSEEDNKDQRWIPKFKIDNGFIELKEETCCKLTEPKISVNEYTYGNSYIISITKGNSSLWFELPNQVGEVPEGDGEGETP